MAGPLIFNYHKNINFRDRRKHSIKTAVRGKPAIPTGISSALEEFNKKIYGQETDTYEAKLKRRIAQNRASYGLRCIGQ